MVRKVLGPRKRNEKFLTNFSIISQRSQPLIQHASTMVFPTYVQHQQRNDFSNTSKQKYSFGMFIPCKQIFVQKAMSLVSGRGNNLLAQNLANMEATCFAEVKNNIFSCSNVDVWY